MLQRDRQVGVERGAVRKEIPTLAGTRYLMEVAPVEEIFGYLAKWTQRREFGDEQSVRNQDAAEIARPFHRADPDQAVCAGTGGHVQGSVANRESCLPGADIASRRRSRKHRPNKR